MQPASRPAVVGRFSRSLGVGAVLAVVVGLAGGTSRIAPARSLAAAQNPRISSVEQADCLAFGDARTARQSATGALRFIGTEPQRPIPHPRPVEASRSPEAAARSYLAVCGALLGLEDQPTLTSAQDQTSQLRMTNKPPLIDRRRHSVVRFQQMHQNVPLLGGEIIVNLDAANNILAVVGKTAPKTSVDTTPSVGAAVAIETALRAVAKAYGVGSAALVATAPELWIYDPTIVGPDRGVATLVWRMEVTPRALLPIRELVLVDAQRGSIALHFNQVESARNRRTYTANNTTTLPGTLVCDESNPACSGGEAHAAAAHVYAGDTYDFYLNTLGRNGIDNAGLTMTSSVHYRANYQNAFWNGSQMVYGDGYGFALADDVVAHELTHGVTQYASNLFYYYQSGAINESLSDVFGEFVDQTNGHGTDDPSVAWLIGEDITGLGAIRNMRNPPAFGHPDKMTSPLYYRQAGDNGGVHTNSGINNKAAYLMVAGGTFNGQTITGLGIGKVARIYYEVQTHLLTSAADYADLADALYQGCNNLVGTSGINPGDCVEVRKATTAVEMNLQPAGGAFNPEAPVCAANQTPSNVFFDDLEGGWGNFVASASTGSARWQRDSAYEPYAHSGLHSLYANDFPAAVTDTSVAMANNVTLPSNAFLHFSQAFGFESGSFDGGVVEYSVNGGSTWMDAGPLFDTNGYTGTVAIGYSNPLAGRPAFVNDSHGYISSRLNLSSLGGQSIRLRWRMGLDLSDYNQGWWLDDVRIYTCPSDVTLTVFADRYRLYSPVTLEHLYTTDFNEYTVLGQQVGVWQQEGVASKMHKGPVTVSGVAAVPYYRLYDKVARWHHWTTDLNEYTVLSGNIARYNGEGVDGYIFKTQVTGTVPWYRLLSKNIPGLHHWTADQNERNVLVGNGAWIEESHEYVFPPSTTTTPAVTLTQNGLLPAPTFTTARPAGNHAALPQKGRPHVLDLNGDGAGDAFLYNSSTGAWRAELTNPLTGGFTEQVGAWVPGLQVYPARLNADAFTDVMVYDPVQGTWAQALNAGDGSFTYTSGTWEPGLTVVPAELDGDGVTDVLRYNVVTGAWARDLVDGAGGFSGSTSGGWDPVWTITAADLTGDGRDDLLLYNAQTGAWLEALSQADGTFDYPASGQWEAGWQLHPADLDGDGRADLVLLNATGTHATALSRADGGFEPLVTGQWDAGATVATGDLNGDGRDDVFVYTPVTGAWVEALSDGTGGFTPVVGQAAPGWAVTLTEVNAAGAGDVLFTRQDGAWVLGTNNGVGTFTFAQGTWGSGWTVFTQMAGDR